VVRFLEQIVCKELDKMCIFRLWDLGEQGMHADAGLTADVLEDWSGDKRFIVSVKHTVTDHWRYQPWNPNITTLAPPTLIEFQCEREYELLGLIPNWLGDLWARGPQECGERELSGVANARPAHWAGVYILPRGGGWAAPRATNDMWAEMNIFAACALCADPEKDPAEILGEWMRKAGFSDAAEPLALFRDSEELMLQLRYLPSYRLITQQLWMPAENWFRDDTFVPGAITKVVHLHLQASLQDALLLQRQDAQELAEAHLTRASRLYGPSGLSSSHPRSGFVLASYAFAVHFARWTRQMFQRLIEQACSGSEIASDDFPSVDAGAGDASTRSNNGLNRETTRQIIQEMLDEDPLADFRVLE
jgi:hypothetical protein